MCSGDNRRRYQVAVSFRCELGGDIGDGGGEGRGEVGENPRTRSGDEPQQHSKEAVGPEYQAGPAFQRSGPRR